MRVARMHQGGNKHQVGGNRLRPVGDVFAEKSLDIAEFVGKQNRVAILLQNLPVVLCGRVNGLGKVSKAHAENYSSTSGLGVEMT